MKHKPLQPPMNPNEQLIWDITFMALAANTNDDSIADNNSQHAELMREVWATRADNAIRAYRKINRGLLR